MLGEVLSHICLIANLTCRPVNKASDGSEMEVCQREGLDCDRSVKRAKEARENIPDFENKM